VSVLIVGSVALDSVTTPFGEVKDVLGGSATFSSYAASFYTPVNLVAVVGKDFPEHYVTLLKDKNISLDGLQFLEGKTFRWSGYYQYDMNQAHSLSTELNVFASFHPHIPPQYRDAEYVFLANIDPSLQLEVLRQVKKPKMVALDTMNYWIQNKKEELIEVIKRVDLVLLNDGEARQLCDTTNLLKAARLVLQMGPKIVIIKKGEHGALMVTNNSVFSAPGYPLEVIFDPTGAGDTFAGGLIGYIAASKNFSDENLRRAVITGSCLASYSVEDFSLNRMKTLQQSDIHERYKAFIDLIQIKPLDGMEG
jgi:sugar/nucleoside kinase (ribokinase family)